MASHVAKNVVIGKIREKINKTYMLINKINKNDFLFFLLAIFLIINVLLFIFDIVLKKW